MDPDVDALNALLSVAANIHRASLLGETSALREYLTNNNEMDNLNLLNLLHDNHDRGKISAIAMKLLHLLHDQNHPLHYKRKRMFLVLTGYKPNWYQKSELLKQALDQLI